MDRLDNQVRDYPWGSAGDIPDFLGIPASVEPVAELGPYVVDRFGPRLPFLLKVLAAARPLSLQVHPDKQYAERAYAAQQRTPGAPRDYTDDNHKPELICALRDGFAGLCGFRPLPDSRQLLAALNVAGLAEISDLLDCANPADGLRNAVT